MIFQPSYESVINLKITFAVVCSGIAASLIGWALVSILPAFLETQTVAWVTGASLGMCYGFFLPIFTPHIFIYTDQAKTWQKLFLNTLRCAVLASLAFGLVDLSHRLAPNNPWLEMQVWPLLSLVLLIKNSHSLTQLTARFLVGLCIGLAMAVVSLLLPSALSLVALIFYGVVLSLCSHWLDNRKTEHCLIVLDGLLMGSNFALHKNLTTLGNEHDDLNFSAYGDVSRTHAKIFRQQNSFWLQNNDPYKNSSLNFRTTDQNNTLKNGDVIQIGQAKLQFCSKSKP